MIGDRELSIQQPKPIPMESTSTKASSSWVRQTTYGSTGESSSDGNEASLALAHAAILGLWMGNNCREISNGTDSILPNFGVQSGVRGRIGQGFSASVNSSNVIVLNQTTMKAFHSGASSFAEAAKNLIENAMEKPGDVEEAVIKRIRVSDGHTPSNAIDFIRELRVLTHDPIRKHPNIVSLFSLDWEFSPFSEIEVLPVVSLENSTLGNLSEFQSQQRLSYAIKKKIFLDIAHGIQVLHECGIVHGDVKAENVLIFPNKSGYTAKVCDFGFSLTTSDIDTDKAALYGSTPLWGAPEAGRALPCPKYLLKLTDLYSLGLLFWRLILDKQNPFSHPLLPAGKEVYVMKLDDPPLLNYAIGTVLLHQEYKEEAYQISQVLAYLLQKRPWKRKLLSAIRAVTHQKTVLSQTSRAQLSSDLSEFVEGSIILRNIRVAIRERLIEHIKNSAIRIADSMKPHPFYANPILLGLVQSSVGDGGFDIDDDPQSALRYATELASRGYVAVQAILVRLYDYFDIPMPLEVELSANEYLANGTINGSLTAMLDYVKYWPTLRFQTSIAPKGFLFSLNGPYCAGLGIRLDEKMFALHDEAAVRRHFKSTDPKSITIQRTYGLAWGNNALHGAVMLGFNGTTNMLIDEFGFDINSTNDNGDTPLLLACRHGHHNVAITLLRHGAKADIANIIGETPLHWVINIPNDMLNYGPGNSRTAKSIVIALLLKTGASSKACAQIFYSGGDFYSRLRWAAGTPLHRAVSRRDLETAKLLIGGKGASDPLASDGSAEGLTPLDIAAHHHNAPMLKLLLNATKYDVNSRDVNGKTLFSRSLANVTVMELIIIHGNGYPQAVNDTLDLLLSHGWDPTDVQRGLVTEKAESFKVDALYLAIYYEKLAWVNYILSSKHCMSKININHPHGATGKTALHQAIQDGRKSIFLALLEHGADLTTTYCNLLLHDKPEATKNTCLHLVVWQGDKTLFFTPKLLSYPSVVALIDSASGNGTTALSAAVETGHLHIANELLKQGADLNKLLIPPSAKGEDTLNSNHKTILGQLLRRGCDTILPQLKWILLPDEMDRPGPPASFKVSRTETAILFFLRQNKYSIDKDSVACLRVLLTAFNGKKHVNYVEEDDEDGVTALHLAAGYGNAGAVQALLEAGADVSKETKNGITAEGMARAVLQLGHVPEEVKSRGPRAVGRWKDGIKEVLARFDRQNGLR